MGPPRGPAGELALFRKVALLRAFMNLFVGVAPMLRPMPLQPLLCPLKSRLQKRM